MKKHYYQITIRDGQSITYGLENLDQIYGLLIGKIDAFQQTFIHIKFFRAWWRDRVEKKKALQFVEGGRQVEFVIEYRY